MVKTIFLLNLFIILFLQTLASCTGRFKKLMITKKTKLKIKKLKD